MITKGMVMPKDKTRLNPKLAVQKSARIKQQKSINIKDFVGFQLAKILKLKRHFVDLEMKKLDLSRTQWQVLLWMKILGPCSQKELLKNLDIDAAHLARVLEELEKIKYISRTPVAGDRRSLFIQMTDFSKRKVIPHIEMALEKEDIVLLDGLTTRDKELLKKLLNKLEENIESAINPEIQKDKNEK